MKIVSFAVTVSLASFAVAAPVAAGSQAQTPCSLISAEDMTLVLGPGAKATPIGDEQCAIKGTAGTYDLHVKRQNAAGEMKDWQMLSMPAPVTKLTGIGDEAYQGSTGNIVIARKGSVAVRVSAGVTPKAPMPFKEGVVELTRRIVAKLK